MVYILDKPPSSVRKRPPEKKSETARVNRAKHAASVPDIEHPPDCELAPSTSSSVAADIQGVLPILRKWMSVIPLIFWLSVSRPQMIKQLYWQCQREVMNCYGVDGLSPGAQRVVDCLVRWLQGVLPDTAPEEVQDFLVKSHLDTVIKAYLDVLSKASRLRLFFTNDFVGAEQFHPRIHSEIHEGLLRAGDECAVVIPAAVVLVGGFEHQKVVSKRFVLPAEAPEELGSLRQELQQQKQQ